MTPLRKLTDRTESDRFFQNKFYLIISKSIIYDIIKPSVPMMPNLRKGTEFIKNRLFWGSKTGKNLHFDVFYATFCTQRLSKKSASKPHLEG